MDMLPSEYIKVSYFWPKSAKKLKKKIKNVLMFFYENNSQTFGVPQITVEGSRDQNLRGGAL